MTTNTVLPDREAAIKVIGFLLRMMQSRKSQIMQKKHKGGQPSQQKEKTQEQFSNRNMSVDNAKE